MNARIRERRAPRIAVIAGLATSGLMLWSATMLFATTSSVVVPIDVKALTKVPKGPLEDTTYWKVLAKERPLAASVSTFVSADKRFEAGVSSYERVTLELRDWPADEFMYIIEGQVEITAASGEPHVYGPGDAFVMPKGFNGTWKQLSDLRKIQVFYASSPE